METTDDELVYSAKEVKETIRFGVKLALTVGFVIGMVVGGLLTAIII